MFIVKCLPIVGTAVNTVEAVKAFADGDGKKGVSKLAQASIGAALDTAFVMSGGLSSLVSAPLTGSTIEGGKIVGKKLMSDVLVKEAGKFTTNVAVRAVTQYTIDKASGNSQLIKRQTSDSGGTPVMFRVAAKTSEAAEALSKGDANKCGFSLAQAAAIAVEPFNKPSRSNKKGHSGGNNDHLQGAGGANDPPRGNRKPYSEHYDSEVDSDGPITAVKVGKNGRVEKLKATVKKKHLKPKGKARREITARVRRFVEKLGQLKYLNGIDLSDQVGHIIADCLGGPHDRTYNFFPQSPYCNSEYYLWMERYVYDFLDSRGDDDFVNLTVELIYADDHIGDSTDRPITVKVIAKYSNGKFATFEMKN